MEKCSVPNSQLPQPTLWSQLEIGEVSWRVRFRFIGGSRIVRLSVHPQCPSASLPQCLHIGSSSIPSPRQMAQNYWLLGTLQLSMYCALWSPQCRMQGLGEPVNQDFWAICSWKRPWWWNRCRSNGNDDQALIETEGKERKKGKDSFVPTLHDWH